MSRNEPDLIAEACRTANEQNLWLSSKRKFYVILCIAANAILPIDRNGLLEQIQKIQSRTIRAAEKRRLGILIRELRDPQWTSEEPIVLSRAERRRREQDHINADQLRALFRDAGNYSEELLVAIQKRAAGILLHGVDATHGDKPAVIERI